MGIGRIGGNMIREKIKTEMKKQGMTAVHLAKVIGCRNATIYDFLNGKKNARSDLVEKIFKTLKIKC